MAKFLKFKEEKREYSQLANPLDGLNDQEIYQRYRFTKEGIYFIHELIKNDLQHESHGGRPTPTIIQLLIALRYLAM